jgi:ABC-type multidrug transport system ATPase subunit/DNA-binding CsgD family transcriptional regulator
MGDRDTDSRAVQSATAGTAWRARLGLVLQEASDLAELTVVEAVRHFAAYYPRPRDPEAVIELVGLADKAGSQVERLSGGQRRRLDVALGIVGNPELLFLDEPTTGFDPQARRAFWTLVTTLAAAGTTILLTTHYPEEAETLADRVAVIVGGRIVAEDTPAGLGGRATAEPLVHWVDTGGPHDVRTATPTALIATGRIVAGNADVKVIVLTTYETDADIVRAVEAGAAGYLLKDAAPAELTRAVFAAARGETVLAPSVAARLVSRIRRPAAPSLSPREIEVLQRVGRGLSNAEIGRDLHIREATAKTHLLRIFQKLGVSDRTAAVTSAMATGLR